MQMQSRDCSREGRVEGGLNKRGRKEYITASVGTAVACELATATRSHKRCLQLSKGLGSRYLERQSESDQSCSNDDADDDSSYDRVTTSAKPGDLAAGEDSLWETDSATVSEAGVEGAGCTGGAGGGGGAGEARACGGGGGGDGGGGDGIAEFAPVSSASDTSVAAIISSVVGTAAAAAAAARSLFKVRTPCLISFVRPDQPFSCMLTNSS
jgi:hypothetical protein